MSAEKPYDITMASGVLDEVEMGIVLLYRQVLEYGFGSIEIVVDHHSFNRATPKPIYKRKDMVDLLTNCS